MQKLIKYILSICLVFICSVTLSSCKKLDNETFDKDVLRVYNCQDYINEGLDEDGNKVAPSVMELWEADFERRNPGRDVTIQYDTFETPENMLNQIKTGKKFDLVCPSDYVIQKMVREDMLEKFDMKILGQEGGYLDNVSPYLADLFEQNGWTEYAACYMWGTLGILYNADFVSEEDVKHWTVMWDEEYKGEMSIKDSIRDTYFMGVMYVYQDQLIEYRDKYENAEIELEEYNESIKNIINQDPNVNDPHLDELESKAALALQEYKNYLDEISNNPTPETLEKVETALKELKHNIFGLEVDSGKSDIVTGKININLAWSGDAVYAIYLAEEEGINLKYSVPEEGSNVWYDGWCMPKGANKELAQDFVNFVSQPEIAILNMDSVMYTSSVVGDDIYDFIVDWYGSDSEDAIPVDLSFFFGDSLSEDRLTDGKAIIYVDEVGGQFSTHFPDEEVLKRCGIMKDFGDKNDDVLKLWISFKGNSVSPIILLSLVGVVFLIAAGIYTVIIVNKIKKKNRRKNFKLGRR